MAMPSKPSALRSNLKRIVAGVLALGMFLAMRRATDRPGAPDVANIRSRFAFARTVLPDPDPQGREVRRYRVVNPSIGHIQAFFSSLGAGVALHDLDGNGLPDDLCRIDTLTDRVVISPVPDTGDRYPAFALDPGGLAIRDEGQLPSGCLPADLNEDGHPDLVVAYAGRSPILYTWHPAASPGAPALTAANYTSSEILPGVVWTTLALNAVDLDGDGHLELVVVNYFADGGQVFNPHATGPMELPASFSRAFNGGGVHILRVTPGELFKPPAFTEVRDALDGIPNRGWGLALGAYDIDGDLLPELYVANDFGPDRFLWNRSTPGHIHFQLIEGDPHQSVPASKVIGRDSFKGMGIDFADLNGDGIPDLFVSNITEPFAFQESQLVFLSTGSLDSLARGKAPYVEGGDKLGLGRSGWAWDAKLDDFDNDGTDEAVQATGFIQGKTSKWPELHELAMVNDQITSHARNSWPILGPDDDVAGHDRNPFYVRVGTRYVDVGAQIGFGEDYPSRGIAIADVKGDGHLDMAVANMMAPTTYYENVGARVGAFLGLHLLLPARGQTLDAAVVHDRHPAAADVAARPAIGAVATVFLPNGGRVSREVDGGNGHTGKRSPDLHFGLGAVNGPVRVEIKWRDASGIHAETRSFTPGWHTVILLPGRTS
jgi:enediyne biosynthesis protein E4